MAEQIPGVPKTDRFGCLILAGGIAVALIGGAWWGWKDAGPKKTEPTESDKRLSRAAEELANADLAAKKAQIEASKKARPKLFDPPTAWTCTRADGGKHLIAIAAVRNIVTECASQRELSLAPACMEFLIEHHAQLQSVFQQVEQLPMPTTPRKSGDLSWDQTDSKVDTMACCSCTADARSYCAKALIDLSKGEANIRGWMRAIGNINDEECVGSDYQRRIDPNRY